MDYDKTCIGWNEEFQKCLLITDSAFYHGHKCKGCPFRETHEHFKERTGRTYEEQLNQIENYMKGKLR